MSKQFKVGRFFVMMAILAFLVCGVTAFFTHRAEHGRTAEERSAYFSGEKAGEGATTPELPTAAALHTLAQERYSREGSGEPMAWAHAFTRGYEDGFKHRAPK